MSNAGAASELRHEMVDPAPAIEADDVDEVAPGRATGSGKATGTAEIVPGSAACRGEAADVLAGGAAAHIEPADPVLKVVVACVPIEAVDRVSGGSAFRADDAEIALEGSAVRAEAAGAEVEVGILRERKVVVHAAKCRAA
ncbi:hypothetical protein PF008_g9071 [Phytophthora fragariae]|uniref:Uncharacterized protein n=1 Tax=Phytophthora fragariae TaxID=53985 RepID=A0A6G0RXX3_9STRA|nr:hypothetical protein PF008_g9071 [Phytophthora fragariae]